MNVRLLLLIAAVPVLAYGASWGVEAKLNSELRSALSQAPDARASARLDRMTRSTSTASSRTMRRSGAAPAGSAPGT
jgi:hypothetical protein